MKGITLNNINWKVELHRINKKEADVIYVVFGKIGLVDLFIFFIETTRAENSSADAPWYQVTYEV